MIVCLSISTWRDEDVGATHYYGQLHQSHSDYFDNTAVCHILTAEQAVALNERDGVTGKECAYAAGEPSERFDDEQSVKEAAIILARKKWGEDVEIYVGDPAQVWEDMEKLIWVRPKKA